MEGLAALQDALDYSGCSGPNFSGNKSLGKVGTTGFLLGVKLERQVGTRRGTAAESIAKQLVRFTTFEC